ncbi:MAG: cation-translocating P-type ATPase [Mycoplasma sp.]|nr:cation-translocating P-type ATPase [Mycoplasma sp.]
MKHNRKYKLIFEGFVTLVSMIFMFIGFYINIPNHFIMSIIMFLLSTFLVFYLELDYFNTYKQLKTFNFTMDFLIALATHITYLYSIIMSIITIVKMGFYHLDMEFWEISYELSFFIGLGHLIEDKLKLKTSLGIKDLLKLQNKNVQILSNGEYIDIKSNKLKKGDIIKIVKGASIPTDGILLSKKAYLDYSSLLGESIPREVLENETILSGSINVGDPLIYKATKTTYDSTLMKVISQLEKIMSNKSKIEVTSQRVVKFFLPSILLISLITFVVWLVLSYQGITFSENVISQTYDEPITNALYHAISTLVIACPCAFGIAAPAAIYSSSSIASKNNILFSSAKIYEMVNKIDYIAFDKTGTITTGKPFVISYKFIKNFDDYIYYLSLFSQHPLSQAIKDFLKNNISFSNIEFDSITEIPGVGIKATKNDNNFSLVSIKYAKDNNFQFDSQLNIDSDNTISVFAINNNIVAIFEIGDSIKDDAKSTIDKFHKLGIKTIILSGDKSDNVKKIAKELSIDYWYGELLPQDKASIVNDFKKKGDIIFVGDGINDVLAIKSATIGIAYASGSEITNSIADISLLDNNLDLVYKTMILAKKTLKLVRLNFLWAILFNLLCIPLAIIGFIPPWLGAMLMICSTSILLINTIISRSRNKKIFM